jgi:hypothetical protein
MVALSVGHAHEALRCRSWVLARSPFIFGSLYVCHLPGLVGSSLDSQVGVLIAIASTLPKLIE